MAPSLWQHLHTNTGISVHFYEPVEMLLLVSLLLINKPFIMFSWTELWENTWLVGLNFFPSPDTYWQPYSRHFVSATQTLLSFVLRQWLLASCSETTLWWQLDWGIVVSLHCCGFQWTKKRNFFLFPKRGQLLSKFSFLMQYFKWAFCPQNVLQH